MQDFYNQDSAPRYSIIVNGNPVGPMTMKQMAAYYVDDNTQVSKDNGPWAPLYTYPELMQYLHPSGNEISNQKILCGIFAILLGSLGVQYFILGKVSGGIVTILLSLITCGLWSVVTLIQGILMLTMSDAEFKRKYVDSPSFMPLF